MSKNKNPTFLSLNFAVDISIVFLVMFGIVDSMEHVEKLIAPDVIGSKEDREEIRTPETLERLRELAKREALYEAGYPSDEVRDLVGNVKDSEISEKHYQLAEGLMKKEDRIVASLIHSRYEKDINPSNDAVARMPGASVVALYADYYGVIPTIPGTQLFIREGEGKIRGTARRKGGYSAYYSFVQTKYGRFYAHAGQEKQSLGKENLNKKVILALGLIDHDRQGIQFIRSNPGASVIELTDDHNLFFDWDQILAMGILDEHSDKKFLEIIKRGAGERIREKKKYLALNRMSTKEKIKEEQIWSIYMLRQLFYEKVRGYKE